MSINQKQPLFRTGDSVKFMYLVLEGHIDLVRFTRGGSRMVIKSAGQMEILAEASAYSPKYHCDAIALEKSLVRFIPVQSFKDRLNADTQISTAWAAYLAHSTQKARMLSEIRNLKTVSERLDAWLGDDQSLPAKGTWINLADTLGVSKETLYRELAKRRS